MAISLHTKPFSFELFRPLHTAHGVLKTKRGFLLHLKNEIGDIGWGEVSPISQSELHLCEGILKSLGGSPSRKQLEESIKFGPGSLGFGIGSGLAELDCLIGNKSDKRWLPPPQSAFLLPTNSSPISYIESILKNLQRNQTDITFKLKVGNQFSQIEEKKLLTKILNFLPKNTLLRIDANGSWGFDEAKEWVNFLSKEPKLEWIEQPLHPEDVSGLKKLAALMPIALDESLLKKPELRESWQSWQVRRPSLEGDPRALLQELTAKRSFRVISTSFETGIGLRWVNHFAALQQSGPTPTAPGLAPGWSPSTALFSSNPELVWEAA